MSTNQIIVVLGMHRSGTSAITRGLQVLGADLGDNLIGGIPDNNEKGFWEDADINAFNDRLLWELGSAWGRLNAIDKQALLGDAFENERKQAQDLLGSKLHDDSIFAFKDPRTTILLPFWQVIFKRLGLAPRYLVAVRHPVEVASSLGKRDGFSLLKGVMLWGKYSIAAIRETNHLPRIFVSYAALMQNPRYQLERISAALHLPSPHERPKELADYTENFLSNSLRHNIASGNTLSGDAQIPPFIVEVFQLLQELSNGCLVDGSAEFIERWAGIESHYQDIVPLMNQLDELERSDNERDEGKGSALDGAGDDELKLHPMRSFHDNLNDLYDEFHGFVDRWNLETIRDGNVCESEGEHLIVGGWAWGKTSRPINIAVRQEGVTRSYPLNVERPDVVQALAENPGERWGDVICGFKYKVKNNAAFDIGFEVDGWIFWLYSGFPA